MRPWSTAIRIPTDGGTGLVQGERSRVRPTRGRCSRCSARPARATCSCRSRVTRRTVAAVRGRRADAAGDAAGRHGRPRHRGVGADPRGVRGAPALARGRGDGRGACWPRASPTVGRTASRTSSSGCSRTRSSGAASTPRSATQAVVARERLVRGRARGAVGGGRLAASGVAPSIQHDDLHGGNILVGPDGRPVLRLGRRGRRPPVRDADDDLQLDRAPHRAEPRRPGLPAAARRLHGGVDRRRAAGRAGRGVRPGADARLHRPVAGLGTCR